MYSLYFVASLFSLSKFLINTLTFLYTLFEIMRYLFTPTTNFKALNLYISKQAKIFLCTKNSCTLILVICILLMQKSGHAQLRWQRVDSVKLPKGIQLYYSNDSIEGKPNIAYYIKADLHNAQLLFDVDTTKGRRLTPQAFYNKNNNPTVVVNGTFFSYATNQNLNTVIKNGKPLAYNIATTKGRGNDSASLVKMYRAAIGISKNRKADVAWINSDSSYKSRARQKPIIPYLYRQLPDRKLAHLFKKWKVNTAIGGGPVLVQKGAMLITNNEELLFAGTAKYDKHPRTAMGYTKSGHLIILVIEGRNVGKAEGANLVQEAAILLDIGCYEALNLDGGGSSCMLVNGKQTITPSDKTGQRAVPAVFMIKQK